MNAQYLIRLVSGNIRSEAGLHCVMFPLLVGYRLYCEKNNRKKPNRYLINLTKNKISRSFFAGDYHCYPQSNRNLAWHSKVT